MALNSTKRLTVALAVVLCAVAAGVVAQSGGVIGAATQRVAAQSAGETRPHGGIGTAAVATQP